MEPLLVVYYSKTGTTRKVAQALIEKIDCVYDELQYDEKANAVSHQYSPSDYERVILLSPIWAFSLAEPMKQYVAKHKSAIKRYDLIVTCGMFGLRGCVRNCVSSIGKRPERALKFKEKDVNQGNFDLSAVL